MVRIAPVALQYNPRVLWFDPGELELKDGDPVIVKTERGTDFGRAKAIIDVSEEELKKLKGKLKPVLRVATEEDLALMEELRQKGRDALPVFKRLAAEVSPDMHPVLVEYLMDGDRAVFFFEAEERIDFRDLVRKLGSELHVRADMRQIGVRDEARIVGGLGHCGQELCCRRLGGEFCPVSIRMAKEQDLSLNPQKISGLCGRLMCCLCYEYDAYKDFKQRAPKQGAKISTPRGVAKVTSLNVPKELITVRQEEDGKEVTFPLSAMDELPEGSESKRPNSIGEAYLEYADPDPFAHSSVLGTIDTSGFTRTDKLAKPEARHNPSRRAASQPESHAEEHRKPRRRRGGRGRDASDEPVQETQIAAGQGANSQKGQGGTDEAATKTSRRRRSRNRGKGQGGADTQAANAQTQSPSSAGQPNQAKGGAKDGKRSARPGQNSSALRAGRPQTERQPSDGEPKAAADAHRKRRRRSHKTGEASGGQAAPGTRE